MANLDLETLVNDINEKAALEDVNTLTYDEIINKLIMESNYPDDVKADLTFYATESFKKSPVAKFMKDLEEIKEAKPDEYTGEEDVKKFVDKNFDKLSDVAKILEKEPSDLNKSSIQNLVAVYGAILLALGTALVNAPVGLFLSFVAFLISIATVVVTYTRSNSDITAVRNLRKIKEGLKKVNKDKLPDSYQKRISRLISNIEDAETSFAENGKAATESAIEKELNEKKLAIYEKCANGEITIEEREEMIANLREDIVMDHIAESDSSNDDAKYNQARLLIYEKCDRGDITEDTREVLLAKLKEKMNR